MPREDFNQFKSLWEKVKEKYVDEKDEDSFSLENLRLHLIELGLLSNQTKFTSIENKFLQYLDSDKPPETVNLSSTIFNALDQYLGSKKEVKVKELLKEKIKDYKREKPVYKIKDYKEIEFLGREKELAELENFLLSTESRIFALYGVPMIGKTKLVNHFLENNETAKTYQVITVKLNPNPENAEEKIKVELFKNKDFNDFSDFSSGTVIVIQNFEETLKWTGNPRDLHDIEDKYSNIKTFLKKLSEIDSIKLILESRFQIHFEVFLPDWRTKVKTLPDVQLRGIEKDEFWQFYESEGFTYEQFETLCKNFDNHTGLLALAYNDAEFLFQNRLIEAYYQPTLTTRFLWNLVERIIDRLEKREAWVLCALTFLQEPVKKENLYEDFLTLPDFEDELQIGDSFNSLANKLLVQLERGHYDLNPYIREVCYTFLKVRRRLQIQKIRNLRYFKEHGKTPHYDEIRQAQERGDYGRFYKLIRKERDKRNYENVHKILNYTLLNDSVINKAGVLNEIGITYKWQKKWKKAIETLEKAVELGNIHSYNELAICYREKNQLDKAIETLEKAVKDNPNNVKILNELGICYREKNQLDKAIETLEKAVELGNIHSYNELAICYREKNQLDKAIETLEKAVKDNPNNVKILNELGICYREKNQLDKAIETLEKARDKHPNDVKTLSVLADIYKRGGYIEKACEVARKGVRASNWKDSRLIRQFEELKNLMKGKQVILFLAANPQGSTLRLDQEMREVENQLLRVAKYRDNFTLNKEVATRITDLQQRLLDETPNFVHFSGHGSDSGIYLTDNQGNYQLVRGEALANLFNLFSDKVRCVFLNSCYSENQANEINKFIPFVIGMNKAVPDDLAIQFAVTFYQAIASGRDIEFAFKMAKNSIDLHDLSGSDIPVLLKKKEILEEDLEQQNQPKKDVKKLKVFLSYSHKDEDIKEELDNHLSLLKRSDKISTWNDRKLPAGAEWDKTIKAELENADIILLLISSNFIASSYIWDIEIKKAIEKHDNGTAVVIPIFCKSCDFGDMPFAKLQGLPKDAKAIASQPDKDQTYTEVAKGIRKVVETQLS